MSTSVDNRVVKMEFDNAQFEQGVSQSLATLTRLDSALNDLENAGGFKGLSQSIQGIGTEIEDTFSFRGVAALTTFKRIAETVISSVVGLFSSLKDNYMPVDFLEQALTGGKNRAANIEDAMFRLKGLGVEWKQISDDVNYAVKGTAYGLDSAAKAASQLVASGIAFGDTFGPTGSSPMAKALRGISGVAAMTNTTYDEIAQIFTTIAGNGKMMTKELRMMSYRGLNVAATLADFFNGVNEGSIQASEDVTAMVAEFTKGAHVTESALREMVTDGAVSSDIFFEAMDHAFGEHATKANETYAGSLSNVRAALSRIGATYFQAHMENMIEVFNALQKAIDNVHEVLKPVIGTFAEFEGVFTHGMAVFLNGTDGSISGFTHLLTIVRHVFEVISTEWNKFFPKLDIDKIKQKIDDINDSLAHLKFRPEAWDAFRGVLDGIFSIASLVKDVLDKIKFILDPWLDTLDVIAGDLVIVFGDLGGKLVDFNEELKNNEGIGKFVAILRVVSEFLAGKVANAFNKVSAAILVFGQVLDYLSLVGLVVWFTVVTKIASIAHAIDQFVDAGVTGFNTLKDSVTTFIDAIKTGFAEGGIAGGFLAFLDVLDLFPAAVDNAFSPFSTLVDTYFGPYVDELRSYIDPLIADIETEFTKLKTDIETKLNEIKVDIWNALPEPIQDAYVKIKGTVLLIKGCFDTLGIFIGTFITSIQNSFSGDSLISPFEVFIEVLKLIPGAIATSFAPLTDLVMSYIDPLIVELETAFDELQATLTTKIDEIKADIWNALPESFQQVYIKIKEKIELIKGCFETLKTSIDGFVDSIVEGFTTGGIEGAVEAFKTAIDSLPTAIKDAFEPLKTDITEALDTAKAKFDEFVEEFNNNEAVQNIKKFFDDIKASVTSLTEGISIGTITDSVVKFFEDIGKAIRDFGSSVADGSFTQAIKDLFDLIVDYVASTAVGQFVTAMYEAGVAAIEGLITGITDGSILEGLWNAITELVGSKESGTGIIGFFANLVGWHSPWAIMIAAGAAAIIGLAIGFRDSAAMQAVREALTSVKNSIVEFFQPVIDAVTDIGTKIRDKFLEIYEPIKPYVDEAVQWAKDNITFANIVKGVGTVISAIGELGTAIANFVSGTIEWIGDKFDKAKEHVTGFFDSFNLKIDLSKLIPNFEEIKKTDSALAKVLGWFESIGTTVKGIAGWIKNALGGDYGEAIQQALGVTLLIAIPSAIYIIGGVANKAKALMGSLIGKLNALHRGAVGILNFFNGFGKAIQMQISIGSIAKVFASLALLVGAIAASIYAIAKLDPSQLEAAEKWFNKFVGFVLTITLLLGGLTAGLAQLSNNTVTTEFKKGRAQITKTLNAMGDTAFTLLALAGAVFIMVKAMESIVKTLNESEISKEDLGTAFGKMADLVLALTIGVGIIAGIQTVGVAIANKSDKLTPLKPKMLGAAIAILATAFAVKILVGAFVDLIGICDAVLNGENFKNGKETIDEAINVLWSLAGAIAAMSLAGSVAGWKGGLGLLSIMASILLLKEVFKVLCDDDAFNIEAIKKHWQAILIALGLITAIMATTRAAGKNAAKGGIAILLITGSVILIMKAFVKMAAALEEVDGDAILKAVFSVIAIMGGVALLVAATNKCASSFKSAAVILTLSSLVVTLTIMMAAMTLCAKLAPGPFLMAGLVFGAMLGMATLLVRATGVLRKTNVKALTGIGFVLAAIGASLVVLSFIPWDRLKFSLLSMSVILGLVIGLMFIMGNTPVVHFGPLVAATVMLGVVAIALGTLSALCDPQKLMQTADGLTKVMLALAGTLAVCTIVGAFAGAAWAGILTLVGFIAIFSMMLWALGDLVADSESVLKGQEVLVGIGRTIGDFIGAIVAGVEEGAASALPAVGEYLTQFADKASGFFKMIEGMDPEKLTSGIKNLISALGQITTNRVWEGIVTSLGNSGNSSMTLFSQNLVEFGVALNAFSAAITANGGIDQTAVDAAVKAGEMLVALESKITPFGNITDFFSKRTFSDFGVSLMDFADGLKRLLSLFTEDVTSEKIDTALTTIDKLVKMENELPKVGGIVSWFEGRSDFGTFGSNLTDFAEALKTFCEKSQDVKVGHINNVINAANKLIELAGTVADSGAGDRGFEFLWFGGKNIYDNFGKNMDELCLKLVSISGSFALIDTNLIITTVGNVEKIVNAFSSMSTIDTAGFTSVTDALGSISVDAITEFINAFSTVDTTQIESVSSFITSFTTALTTKATEFETPGKDSATSFRTGFETQSAIDAPLAATTIITEFATALSTEIANGKMNQAGIDAVTGFAQAISDNSEFARQSGADLGTTFLDGFRSTTGWGSPWTTLLDAGKDAIGGLIAGFTDGGMLSQLQAVVEEIGGDHEAGTGILGWFGRAVGWGSDWTSTIEAARDALGGLITGLTDEQLISILDTAAAKVGEDTVKSVVEGLQTGDVDLMTVAKQLGLDVGFSLSDGITIGGVSVMSSLDALIAQAEGKLGSFSSLLSSGVHAIGSSINMSTAQGQAAAIEAGLIDPVKMVEEELKRLQEEADKAAGNGGGGGGGGGGGLTGLSKAAGGAGKSTKDAAEEAKKHADAIKHQNEAVSAFIELFGKTEAVLNSGTDATTFAKEAIDQLAQVFGKSADEIGMSEESLEEMFISMYDTVKQSIEGSVSMFDEFKVEASGSVRDLIHNMESNLEGLDTWGERLAQLAVRGFAPKLIEELQAAGPKAMNQANTLLKATVDEMGQINSLYGQKDTKIEEVTAKVIASMAYATKVQESLAHVSENYAKAMSFEDASARFKTELDAFAQYGVDANQTLFGNIEMSNRQVLEWTEENLEKYHDILTDYFTDDEIKNLPNTISTVLGSIGDFGENGDIKIAFSPILQTDSGPELLSQSTIDAYIDGILDVARTELGEFSDEDLLRLDTEGLEIDGIKIKNIFAGINESAEKTDEIMHYIGQDGSLAKSWEDFELAAKKAAAEVAARIDELKINYVDLKNTVRDTVKNQIDLFSKFEEKDAMSSTEILNNMKSQIDGFRNWGANLAVISQRAAEMNFSEDGAFLQMLAQMGPKSSNLIAGIAASTDEEFAAMASMWETSLTLPDEISALVGDSYLNAGLGAANGFLTSINQQLAIGKEALRQAMNNTAMYSMQGAEAGFSTEGAVLQEQLRQEGTDEYNAYNEGQGVASPSWKYAQTAMWCIQGFVNGINSNAQYAKTTMRALADAIVSIAEEILSEDKFFEFGENVGAGLAAGMIASIPVVTKAAEALMGASSSGSPIPTGGAVDTLDRAGKFGSPSKVTTQYGIWLGQGLANGMRAEIPDVTDRAFEMSNALLEALNTTVTDGLDEGLRPTITPVLDLSDVQNGLGSMNSMFSNSTLYASGLSSGVGRIDLTNRSLSKLADAINGFNNTPSYGNVTINIHTQPGQNAKDIADMTLNRLNNQMKRRRAAFG